MKLLFDRTLEFECVREPRGIIYFISHVCLKQFVLHNFVVLYLQVIGKGIYIFHGRS